MVVGAEVVMVTAATATTTSTPNTRIEIILPPPIAMVDVVIVITATRTEIPTTIHPRPIIAMIMRTVAVVVIPDRLAPTTAEIVTEVTATEECHHLSTIEVHPVNRHHSLSKDPSAR